MENLFSARSDEAILSLLLHNQADCDAALPMFARIFERRGFLIARRGTVHWDSEAGQVVLDGWCFERECQAV